MAVVQKSAFVCAAAEASARYVAAECRRDGRGVISSQRTDRDIIADDGSGRLTQADVTRASSRRAEEDNARFGPVFHHLRHRRDGRLVGRRKPSFGCGLDHIGNEAFESCWRGDGYPSRTLR